VANTLSDRVAGGHSSHNSLGMRSSAAAVGLGGCKGWEGRGGSSPSRQEGKGASVWSGESMCRGESGACIAKETHINREVCFRKEWLSRNKTKTQQKKHP